MKKFILKNAEGEVLCESRSKSDIYYKMYEISSENPDANFDVDKIDTADAVMDFLGDVRTLQDLAVGNSTIHSFDISVGNTSFSGLTVTVSVYDKTFKAMANVSVYEDSSEEDIRAAYQTVSDLLKGEAA